MPTLAPHPFWLFSLRTYGKPGVEQACLRLQDRHGADVNLVLLCCWAAASGRAALATRTIRASIASTKHWQAEVIGPLRTARHSLKQGFEGVPPERTAELRKSIGRVELECEHAEQLLLAPHVDALPKVQDADPARSAKIGIERYFGCLGARLDKAAREDVATVIQAALTP
ncbi:MAG: TIGR02444 family protein [Betaproteobacteria bacterium]|nr:TIGR02444 family protein [Betaproteobacteria bacterium]